MKKLYLDVCKIVAYIEDYCAVLAFASDESAEPESYLILTRETEHPSASPMVGDYEWDLVMNFEGEIRYLTDYKLCTAHQLNFYFDNYTLCLQINIVNEYDIQLEQWLELIFKA